MQSGPGTVTLSGRVRVALDEALEAVWPLLSSVLGTRLGLQLVPVDPVAAPAAAPVVIERDTALEPEGYHLVVADRPGEPSVRIRAADPAGARHAVRTLQQVAGIAAFRAVPIGGAGGRAETGGSAETGASAEAPAVVLPEVRIQDAPRFGHRGVLLDVARHFLPKDQVLRFIEHASMHKLNVLHLHLTDDQGWRMEIKAYPRLTQVGGWRTESQVGSSRSEHYDGQPHGGWYTQDDLREMVAFARTRGVTLIPEIDVPGHAQAAMAAYPELSAAGLTLPVWTSWGLNPNAVDTSEAAVEFFATVLSEVIDVFDSPVICLGGDEVATQQWHANPRIRAQAQDLGLTSVEELLSWFCGQLAEYCRKRGRSASVWDEVGGSRLGSDVVVLSWRGTDAAVEAVREGRDVVICPEHEVYLDHRAAPGLAEPAPVGTVHTLQDVYQFEPITQPLAQALAEPGAGTVRGAQAQVWREQLTDARWTDYATYPRLSAFAEVVWSQPEQRDWDDFSARIVGHLQRLAAAGIEYRPLSGPLPWQQRPGVAGWPLRWDEQGRLVHAPDGEP